MKFRLDIYVEHSLQSKNTALPEIINIELF